MRRRPGAFAATVLASLAAHGGVVIWMQFPAAAEPPPPPPPLVVNLEPPPEIPETMPPMPAPPPEPVVAPRPVEPTPVPKAPAPPIETPVEPVSPPPVPAAPPVVETASVADVSAVPAINPAVELEYEQRVVAWLNRHKRYPRPAERRRLEGECVLRVRLNRSGQVLSAALASSCGAALLDNAALDMVERAQPFPPFPAEASAADAEYLIPVMFSLE